MQYIKLTQYSIEFKFKCHKKTEKICLKMKNQKLFSVCYSNYSTVKTLCNHTKLLQAKQV
jgi:hypothetical protein